MTANYTISVLFSVPKKMELLSWIVKTFERTEYSHVCIRVKEDSRDYVINITPSQERVIAYCYFADDNDIIKEFEISVSEEHKLMLYERLMAPTPHYSYFKVVGLGLKKILKRFRPSSKTPFWNRPGIICTEFVGGVLLSIGLLSSGVETSVKELFDNLSSTLGK